MPSVNARVLTWNVGPRSSFGPAAISWLARRRRVVDVLRGMPKGPPSVLLLQECTATQQHYIATKLGYESFGNGNGGHPRDRSGDNVVVMWNPGDWDRVGSGVSVVGQFRGVEDYCSAVPLQRIGTRKVRWFASSHPTVGGDVATRIGQVTGQAVALKARGVDLERLIWGMDANDTHPSDEPGVRRVLRSVGLRDAQTQTVPPTELGSTAHHFGRTSYQPRAGYRPIDLQAANPLQQRPRYLTVVRGDVKAADHYPVLVGWELI